MMLSPYVFLGISAVAGSCVALNLPIERRAPSGSNVSYPVSVTNDNGTVGFNFTNAYGVTYTATVIVNGVPFQLVLDTGSSDLWIDPAATNSTPEGLIQTGINVTTQYVDGSVASGPVVLGNVTFGAYSIDNQALYLAQNASTQPDLFQGIIGLSRTIISEVNNATQNTSFAENGRNIMNNLFALQPDLPNYITFLLSRSYLGITDGGVFTISELLTNMTDIVDQPRLPVVQNYTWTAFLEGVYINGQFVNGNSNVTEAYARRNISVPEGDTLVTLDTGSSLMRGPRAYVDALYQNVSGAKFIENADGVGGDGYIVPCDMKANFSFVLGGQSYPVNPVDLTTVNISETGTLSCIGSLTVTDYSYGPPEDWLVGDTFLRNVYSLYDYGDETDSDDGLPFMQLLSTTNYEEAWAQADAALEERSKAFQDYVDSQLNPQPNSTTTSEGVAYTSTQSASLTMTDNESGEFPSASPTIY